MLFSFKGLKQEAEEAMGIIDNIVGANIAAPITAAGDALDKLFTSDKERGEINIAKQEITAKLNASQVEINKIEATASNLFVSGWRPFIGWVCAISLAWNFILFDLVYWLSHIFHVGAPPHIDDEQNLMSLVVSLLGLGGLRTYEKTQGLEK